MAKKFVTIFFAKRSNATNATPRQRQRHAINVRRVMFSYFFTEPTLSTEFPFQQHEKPPTCRRPSICLLPRKTLVSAVVSALSSFSLVEKLAVPEQTTFHGLCLPDIPLSDYLERILDHGRISNSTLIIALIYLDRLITTSTTVVRITNWTVHRTLLAAAVLAGKFHNDDYYTNSHMASVGGVTLKELNAMELELIRDLQFNLWVSPEIFSKYEDSILSVQE